MKRHVLPAAFLFLLSALQLTGQTTATTPVNQTQQLVFAGLRTAAAQGQFTAVQSDRSGNLFLLLNQGDGVRLLKTDASAQTLLAQTLLGATGDIGLALALDPAGNVFVTGTTSSTALTGTSGAAIPTRTDASTNSFVARFDPSTLAPVFVTFTGGSRIAASSLAATADAVFVTGSLFTSTLPVTGDGIQQSPAPGSTQNGFVEKFSSDGATLLYATYLTGAQGNTSPTAIAADAADNAYIVGSTTASGYPTVAALVPNTLTSPSGFLTKLTPAGDGITLSTFIPGPGLTSIALSTDAQSLLLTGSIAPGQFPIQTVLTPLAAPLTYQSLLQLPLDASSVTSSILLAPGNTSLATPTPSGAIWVAETLTAPLIPTPTLASLGTGLALRLTPSTTGQLAIDQSARFGGLPNANPTFASIPLTLTSIALDTSTDPSGEPLIAGAAQPTASSTLLATETYDLPLIPTPVLPSTIHAAIPTAASCTGSLCPGSAAYLAKLNPAVSAPTLALSADDNPFLILRNLGSAAAQSLQLTATNATLSTNCPTSLPSAAECNILLTSDTSGNPATLTASAANASSQSVTVPTPPIPASTIVFSPKELDYGIQTSTSPAALRTVTITNLGPTPQSFASGIPTTPKSPTPPFTESSTDCPGTPTLHTLAPATTCHITIALTVPSTPSSDALLSQYWQVGTRSLLLTAYTQAASLALSSTQIDFGTQFRSGLRLPRFLHLSNASSTPLAHTPLTLPASSPFTLTDTCPTLIPAQSVCPIRIDYLSPTVPSKDSVLLSLDPNGLGQTLTVLVTGQSLPQPGVGGATVNPNLAYSPTSLTFPTPVPITGVSATSQNITITNTGASPFSLALTLTGDFTSQSSCPSALPGGQTCAVALTFIPSQPGTRQGLLSIAAGGATFSPAYVSLTGTATPILPANNGTLDQGSTTLGEPVTHLYKIAQPFSTLTATATGPYSVALLPDTGFTPAATTFTPATTSSCPNCYLAIHFNPAATGPQPGTLTLASSPAGAPYTLVLTGTGLAASGLQLTPLTPSFGSIPVNSTSPPTLFTLTNLTPGGQAITLLAPTLTGDYALSPTPTGGQSCTPGTLAYSASCLLNVVFAPTATGTRPGTLTLTTATGDSVTATLTATATPDPGLSFNPTALVFQNVPGPSATQQSITLTNTGTATLTLAPPTVTSPAFAPISTCTTLAPTQTCTLTVTFTPTSALISDVLSLPVTATTPGGTITSTTYTVPLTGAYTSTSAGLLITPAQSDFGPTPILTQGGLRQFTLQNLTPHSYTLALTLPRQFALIGSPCTALAPTSSCTVTLEFTPLTNAQITGSLIVTATPSDASPTLTSIAYLQGFGTPSAGPPPPTAPPQTPIQSGVLNFGQVTSGQSGTIPLTLANRNPIGSPSITIRRVTSAPPFLSSTACPIALAPAQSCTVTLTYVPTNQVPSGTASPASTSDTGLLTLESDASSSPDLLNLSGQAGPLAVSNPTNASALRTFTLSQGSLTFPSTQVGDTSSAQTVTLTNTGLVTLHLASLTVPPDFTLVNACPATLLAGASCTLTLTATPQSPGPHLAALQIASDSTSSLDFLSLLATSTANALAISPSALDFGGLQLGQTSTLPVDITNTSASPVLFTSITATGDYTPTGTCPPAGSPLPGGATCTVQVAFTPSQTGPRPATLSIASSASTNPLTVPLTGIGMQSQLVVTPSALAFGSIVLGGSANQTLTVTNSGSADITRLAFTLDAPDYALTNPCPLTTLRPAQNCTAQITFTPTALGPRPSTLTIASSDKSSPLTIPLTGTGLSAGSFTLTVNGAASATVTTTAPYPAHYTLTLTPTAGYSGTVALTCAPVIPAPYGSCSLQASTLTLSGSPLTSTATLNTVTGIKTSAILAPLTLTALLLCTPLFRMKRRSVILSEVRRAFRYGRSRRTPLKPIPPQPSTDSRENARSSFFLILLSLTTLLTLTACGGGRNPNVQLTPPGTYQYTVTASSTSGPTLTQTITLTLIVQ